MQSRFTFSVFPYRPRPATPDSDDASNLVPSLDFPAPLLQLRSQTPNHPVVFVNFDRRLRQICPSNLSPTKCEGLGATSFLALTLRPFAVGALRRLGVSFFCFIVVSLIFDHACASFLQGAV